MKGIFFLSKKEPFKPEKPQNEKKKIKNEEKVSTISDVEMMNKG